MILKTLSWHSLKIFLSGNKGLKDWLLEAEIPTGQ